MTEVRDNPAAHRFELDAGGDVAIAAYRIADGTIVFTHTEVPASLRGQGIGSRLAEGALTLAKQRGLKIVPRCSFIADYVARHPRWQAQLA